ncbi:hypothetical protein [Olleya sp. Bg11-27]|uniref:hypothetical protein n=1 Tax=Olleya sp. Bg11-27 TaxID=2058135 RepID=UPI000C30E5C6|nr:hypothetical protein [Olleya sp. Bg11-27]AUC76868.1 hypothetical protein CW732_14750 [Olleya sp. Bg11-27]
MVITIGLIISFIAVFILAWLFIKTIGDNKWVSLLITLVATPLLYFYLFYPIVNIFSSYHHQKYFNSENWVEFPELRFEMMDQLNNENQLIGQSKSKIAADFGTAEWYGWDDSIKANSKDQWNYNMGFKPGAFNTEQECIELQFKNDTVAAIKTYKLEKKFE